MVTYLGSSLFPEPLTKEEEQEALHRLAEGDEEARNQFVMFNMRLVLSICGRFNTTKNNRAPIEFWQNLFDWEEIPTIIQNAKFVDITPYREIVINTFMNRQLLNFIKVYSLLGREGFLKEVSDRVSSLNDKSNPVMNRRLRCLMLQLNQMDLKIDGYSSGLFVDKDFQIRFKY